MKNNKTEFFPIPALRESLRLRSGQLSSRLGRSVARQTSCDDLPCLEYGDEVKLEYTLAERLFYVQHCRTALEQCIASGSAVLRYRWADGQVTRTQFRKTGPNRVKVTGLWQEAA